MSCDDGLGVLRHQHQGEDRDGEDEALEAREVRGWTVRLCRTLSRANPCIADFVGLVERIHVSQTLSDFVKSESMYRSLSTATSPS
jgi:hypothetical protein